MVFTGCGTYEIVPFQAPTLNANSWEGKTTPGADLALISGSGDTAKYLIINCRSGFFLTATNNNTIVSTPQVPPTEPGAHWTIKSATTSGYEVFTINNEMYGQLTVKDFSAESGADILSATKQDADNQKWYFDAK
ncbi:hypothetical protein NHQ30_006136 [Ciborinia camelliae]|nr:hypothetical protein NHQ30_006136 [Ciborinia camelliae]